MGDLTHLPVRPHATDSLFGPERVGCTCIVDGRAIPNLIVRDRGDAVEFILDGRFSYEFPREWAYLAAAFASQAMAIGAGYPWLGANGKSAPFAPQVAQIDLPSEPGHDHEG